MECSVQGHSRCGIRVPYQAYLLQAVLNGAVLIIFVVILSGYLCHFPQETLCNTTFRIAI